MKHHLVRVGALIGAATLVGLSMGPATAARPVSQATANALTLEIGGSGGGSGTVAAKNLGEGQVKTGKTNPPIDVLDNQRLVGTGVLAQDATARVVNRKGLSRACAGVAGPGASVAEVGDNNCLNPGQPLDISFVNLDLTGASLADPAGALAPLNQLGDPLIQQLVGPLTQAVSNGLQQIGEVSVGGTLGVVEARCTANPGSARGTANIVDSKLTANVMGNEFVLEQLPAYPPANTKVVTDLDVVLDTVIDALEVDLQNSLRGAFADLVQLTDAVQAAIIDNVIAQIADSLAPLEENILDVTLNKQSKTDAGRRVAVSGVDAQVLPAAREFSGSSLISAQIANVTCGPSSRVQGPSGPSGPSGPDGPSGPNAPDVPTTIDAGASTGGVDQVALVAGLLMLGGAAGLIGYRRLLGR